MKRVLLFCLLCLLLTGCSDLSEAAPGWPERITGSGDDSVTLAFRGETWVQSGVDSVSGLNALLFQPQPGQTLAVTWRKLGRGEIELMADYIGDSAEQTGFWETNYEEPSAAVCYLELDSIWLELKAYCPGAERSELLALLDGSVTVSLPERGEACPSSRNAA